MLNGERDAEVGEERKPVGQQDILRLDVAVYHALAMRGLQRGGELTREAGHIHRRDCALSLESIAKCFALHVRHHVEEPSRRLAGVEE